MLDDFSGSSSLEGSEVDSEKDVATNSGLIKDFLFLFVFLVVVVLFWFWCVSLGSGFSPSWGLEGVSKLEGDSGFSLSWGLEGVSKLEGDFGFCSSGLVFLVDLTHQSLWVWGIGASGSVFMAVFAHSPRSLALSGGMAMGVMMLYSGSTVGS